MADPNGFIQELKRRKVFRVAVVYAAVGWGIVEAAATTFPMLGLPDWAPTLVMALVLAGFPVAVILAWALEVTPAGVRRTEPLPSGSPGPPSRPWTASRIAVVGAVMILAVAGGAFVVMGGGDELPTQRTRVAVLPLENRTGDPTLDAMGEMAADWITNGLSRADLTNVVPFQNILAIARENPAEASRLQQSWPDETGATMAFQGAIYAAGDSIQFALRIVDPDGQVLVSMDPVFGDRAAPSEALGPLQVAAAGALARLVDPNNDLAWTTLGRHPPSPEAHQAFLEALTVFNRNPNAASRPLLERAIELAPDFLNPVMLLMVTYLNTGPLSRADSLARVLDARRDELAPQQRLQLTMFEADLRGDNWEAYQDARRLAEEYNPYWYYLVGLYARDSNLPQAAVEAFEKWDPYAGRSAREWAPIYWNQYAGALHHLERYEEELALVRRARSEHPDRRLLIRREAGTLVALGRIDSAMALVDEVVATLPAGEAPLQYLRHFANELDAHGYPDRATRYDQRALDWLESRPPDVMESVENRSSRAASLIVLERNEGARALLRNLVEEAPDVGLVGSLGLVEARLGDRARADQLSERLRTWDDEFLRGSHTYQRAVIAAALGDLDDAVGLLEQAFWEGFLIRDHPRHDRFLKPLRGYPPFEELIRPKG